MRHGAISLSTRTRGTTVAHATTVTRRPTTEYDSGRPKTGGRAVLPQAIGPPRRPYVPKAHRPPPLFRKKMHGDAFFWQQSPQKKQYTIGTEWCPCRAVARTGRRSSSFCCAHAHLRPGQGRPPCKPRIWRLRKGICPHSVFRCFAPSDEAE